MKKIYFIGLAVIASLFSIERTSAQLTSSQLTPSINDSIIEYSYGGNFVIDAGSAGDNQVWDYSNKIGTVYSTYKYKSCQIEVNCNMFPTNNLMNVQTLSNTTATYIYNFLI